MQATAEEIIQAIKDGFMPGKFGWTHPRYRGRFSVSEVLRVSKGLLKPPTVDAKWCGHQDSNPCNC